MARALLVASLACSFAFVSARAGAQAADAAAADAMRAADAARAEVSSADQQCAHAEGLCAGLVG